MRRKHQYKEGYSRSLEGKEVEWEQVKRAMVENAREVCGSVRVGEGNPKSMRWSD